MIDFSKKRQARARDENVDVRQLAVAELMAWGWDALDAMLAVGLVKETDTKLDAQHTAVNVTATDPFVKLHRKRTSQLRNGSVLDEYQKLHPTPGSPGSMKGAKRADGTTATRKAWQGDTPEPVTDEELLAKIWETICKLNVDDPKRVDLLDKYDKLKRRQGAGTDDTTIHFYLPRPECDTCPFRGNHIITEPETTAPETDDMDGEDGDEPKPGYSMYGKKLGRPTTRKGKKRGRKPKSKTDDTIPEKPSDNEDTQTEAKETIELFSLEEEL